MKIEEARLPGVLVIDPPTVFEDFRGSYVESYNKELYSSKGVAVDFVQDDFSISSQGVLRGLHGDRETYKLISCPIGRLYVVVVNNDPESSHFRQWQSFTISESNRRQILVPPSHGLGHLVLSERGMFMYKQSTYYSRRSQFTLLWNDPALKIWWPTSNPILSERDSGRTLD
jgi:dTDP-4-dehydrorhamnose 3,5-epimerase